MSSGVEEKSSLCPSPKTTAAGGKTLGGKKNKKAQVPSNQRSILSFMRPAEEAGEKSVPQETGCITARKSPAPTKPVAENASESKRAKIFKQEPVGYADNLSVKTDEESKYTLHDNPKEVPFNAEGYADVILIEDDEYPDELKYEDAAGYDVEEDDLSEQIYEEAGYLEEEGFILDEDRYRLAGMDSDEDYEALRESFDKSMHRVIRYLWYNAQTPFEEISHAESYIAPGMCQWLRRADAEVVYRLPTHSCSSKGEPLT
ncbi:hypothetical protein BDV36DRAFT_255253 [Aspergillus pseudocaelatus]|uniref:Uncharacterized protein n=1 Tax=Aspergillus pseudocaelatus TaxID=1825620 RepID=A0ABQ6WL56_9EURO|nr:hypothetical protein BDV36DRAFT_255253 [Aspergillus pseudocaelatus]